MKLLKGAWHWFDDRTGISNVVKPLALHRVPPGATWWYVFGSATLFAFIVQVVTGIALATMYVPSAGEAYQSLQYISHDALLGNWLRGIHYFGASAMVVFVGIHMARTFLTAAYKYPREMNWLTGVSLLFLTLGMAFTGQLLRWDQDAVWSAVVGAEQAGRVPFIGTLLAHFILGGGTVGGATLSRFFAFHVFFIPAVIFGAVGFHLYLVIRNGISEPPRAGRPVDPSNYRAWYHTMLQRDGQPFWPDSAWRDALFGAGLVAVIVGLALFVGPKELGKPPDPTSVQAYPVPDWYFLWYFAVLAMLPHGSEAYVIVIAPLLAVVALLSVPFISNRGERSPTRRPWAVAIVFIAVAAIGGLTITGIQEPWAPKLAAQPLPAHVAGGTGGAVDQGALLFHNKGCEACHTIAGYGGNRGPNLTQVGDRLTSEEIRVYITNGAHNMPSYLSTLTPEQLDDIVAFLKSRTGDREQGTGNREQGMGDREQETRANRGEQ